MRPGRRQDSGADDAEHSAADVSARVGLVEPSPLEMHYRRLLRMLRLDIARSGNPR